MKLWQASDGQIILNLKKEAEFRPIALLMESSVLGSFPIPSPLLFIMLLGRFPANVLSGFEPETGAGATYFHLNDLQVRG